MSAETNKSMRTVRTTMMMVLLSVIAIGFVASAQPTESKVHVEPDVPLPQQPSAPDPEPLVSHAPVVVVPALPTEEETLLGLSQVCYSESRRRSDCNAIWQVARTIRGCIALDGTYTKCSNPHVRREAPLEALRRHSGRVLGQRPTTMRRLLAIRQLRLNGTRPALMERGPWEAAERQAWLDTIEWARAAIATNPQVCSRGPSTWGGPGVDGERIARMTGPEGRYDLVHCGDTANQFLRVRR